MSLATILVAFHIISLAFAAYAISAAVFAVLSGAIGSPVTPETVKTIRQASRRAVIGLAGLWLTGAALLAVIYADDPAMLWSGKLVAKLVTVAVLTVAGLLVSRWVIPFIEGKMGRTLFTLDNLPALVAFAAVGSVSLLSWITAAYLSLVPGMNNGVSSGYFLWNWGWLMLAGWFIIMIVGILTMRDRESAEGGGQTLAEIVALRRGNDALARRVDAVMALSERRKAA